MTLERRVQSQSPHSVTNMARSPKIKIASHKPQEAEIMAHFEREAAVKDYLVLTRIMQRRAETGLPPPPAFPSLTSLYPPPPPSTTMRLPDSTPAVDEDDDHDDNNNNEDDDMVFDLEL